MMPAEIRASGSATFWKSGVSALSIGLLACAFSLHAQTSAPPEVRIRSGPYAFPQATISVQANLVESGVTVRDGDGVPMGGFGINDFEIFDNGKPQEITFFSVQGNSRA